MRTRGYFNFTLILAGLCAWTVAAATDWPQFGYDQAHSGFNASENGYSTSSGNQLLFSYSLPTPVDSAPIYLGNVSTDSGTKNLLFLIARNGTLLVLDADTTTLELIWSEQPTGSGSLTTGSPVVDPNGQYVYAYALDGKVHKYQVGDGTEITSGGWPEVSTLKPDVEKGASSLSIATTPQGNFLYSVTDGYIGDSNDYQGHVTTIDLNTGSQNVFNAMCSQLSMHFVKAGTANVDDCDLEGTSSSHGTGQMGGIWGRPGVVYDSAKNRIFFATGNGIFDANQTTGNHFDWGDSVLALNSDGTGLGNGMPLDSATPKPFVVDYAWPADQDLGSTSPAVLPSTSTSLPHLAVQGGKEGCVRLFNLDNLNGHNAPGYADPSVAPELNSSTSCSTDGVGAQIRTQPAVWVNPANGATWFYIATDSKIFGYQLIIDNSGNASLSKQWNRSNGGTSPVVANGEVYYVSSAHVYALDATTGNPIWSDTSIGTIHWQSPILVNGRVYAIDNASRLWVYRLDGVFRGGFD